MISMFDGKEHNGKAISCIAMLHVCLLNLTIKGKQNMFNLEKKCKVISCIAIQVI